MDTLYDTNNWIKVNSDDNLNENKEIEDKDIDNVDASSNTNRCKDNDKTAKIAKNYYNIKSDNTNNVDNNHPLLKTITRKMAKTTTAYTNNITYHIKQHDNDDNYHND